MRRGFGGGGGSGGIFIRSISRFLPFGRPAEQTCSNPPSALFLGNSHVSAFKLAYDDLKDEIEADIEFFCAQGADVFFTKIDDKRIVPVEKGVIDERQLRHFYGLRERPPSHYKRNDIPLSDVAVQFENTGGRRAIDLTGVDAIFYVIGMSPYDFVRIGCLVESDSRSRRHELLHAMLNDHFILRRQMVEIKTVLPACKHYLIGRPLALYTDFDYDAFRQIDIARRRRNIKSLAQKFLFDDVIMPPACVLTRSLLATKQDYFVEGRQEAEIFQKACPTAADNSHVNRFYGRAMFRETIIPLLRRLRPYPAPLIRP